MKVKIVKPDQCLTETRTLSLCRTEGGNVPAVIMLWIYGVTTYLLVISPGSCRHSLTTSVFTSVAFPLWYSSHTYRCILYILALLSQRITTFGTLENFSFFYNPANLWAQSGQPDHHTLNVSSKSLYIPICHLSSHLANHSPDSLEKPYNARWRPSFPLLPLSAPYFCPLLCSSNLCIISFLRSCLL